MKDKNAVIAMCVYFFTALRVLFSKSNDRFLSGVSNKSGLPKLTDFYLDFAIRSLRSFSTFVPPFKHLPFRLAQAHT